LAKGHEWHLVIEQITTISEANVHSEGVVVQITVKDLLLILVAGVLGGTLLNVVLKWVQLVVIVVFYLHVAKVVDFNVSGCYFWLSKHVGRLPMEPSILVGGR
jgi:hypothetical protein